MCNIKCPKCNGSVTIDYEYNDEYEPGAIRYRELVVAVYKLFNIGLYTAFYIQS